MASNTAIKKSKQSHVSISKRRLAETAKEMENAAVMAAIAGEKEAFRGAAKLKEAGEMEKVGAAFIAQGASDLTRAVDDKVASERMAVLSDVVATAGVVDVAEGAEMLSASQDVDVMSALVGMMSHEDIQHGLELARFSGELLTVKDMVESLKMPVLADFLLERAARLHEMSVEQIRFAISTKGVSQVLANAGQKITSLGENEVEEGMMRLSTSEVVARESVTRSMSSEDLAAQGIAEMVIGNELTQDAKAEAEQGVTEISSGSAVMGAALAMDDMAATLKDKTGKKKNQSKK